MKNANNILCLVLLVFFFIPVSCIKEYDSGIFEGRNLLVIDGSLVKGNKIQKVIISRSIGTGDDTVSYESGCTVYIEDDLGNTITFYEDSTGFYTTQVDDASMVIGRNYRLHVKTYDGESYVSDYEALIECPEVDTVYSGIEYIYSNELNTETLGMQFYIDVKATESDTKYYRWLLEEDYQVIVPYPYHFYFNGDSIIWGTPLIPETDQPDYSLTTCYNHSTVLNLYSSSTANLTVNEKKKIPLNNVYYNSIKLTSRYSILVKQHSLTEKAYNYWQQRKTEIESGSNLYTSQPGQASSNMHNINNSSEQILGFFWVSQKKEKRFFFKGDFGGVDYFNCQLDTLPVTSISGLTAYYDSKYPNITYPIYVLAYPGVEAFTSDIECFDCRKHGGDTAKPDFWIEE